MNPSTTTLDLCDGNTRTASVLEITLLELTSDLAMDLSFHRGPHTKPTGTGLLGPHCATMRPPEVVNNFKYVFIKKYPISQVFTFLWQF
jgi:hypothetical protein